MAHLGYKLESVISNKELLKIFSKYEKKVSELHIESNIKKESIVVASNNNKYEEKARELPLNGPLVKKLRGVIKTGVRYKNSLEMCSVDKINVDEDLIVQYIQNPKILKDFAIYYDLFKKYQSDYKIEKILEGKAPEEIKSRAKEAKFDERLSLIGLLLDSVGISVKEVVE